MTVAPLSISPLASATPSLKAAPNAVPGKNGSFGATLSQIFEDAVATGHSAELKSSQAIQGTGNATDVAIAVSKAELTLQTAVSVRDHVVQAYQDIMKMPI